MRTTKTQQLIEHMQAGDWTRALSIANGFRKLGPYRDVIRTAHECGHHPEFYRQCGQDPERAIAAGIAALKTLYPERNQ